jgi:hypothetical protein
MCDEIRDADTFSESVESNVRSAGTESESLRVEELLLEGLNTGSDIEATPDFWVQLRLDAARMLRERRAP